MYVKQNDSPLKVLKQNCAVKNGGGYFMIWLHFSQWCWCDLVKIGKIVNAEKYSQICHAMPVFNTLSMQ